MLMCCEAEFPWSKYIELAEALFERSSNYNKPINPIDAECLERNVISRAYFGVFCLCRNFADEEGWIDKSKRDNYHDILPKVLITPENELDSNILANYQLSLMKKVGKKIQKMRRARNRADYDDYYPSTLQVNFKRDSEKGLEFAKYIKNNLDKLIKNNQNVS